MRSAAKIDEGFVSRVYRTSVYVGAFGIMVSWSVAGPWAALGWTLGSVVSVGVLAAIDWLVRRAAGSVDVRAGRKLMKAVALHWPIILILLVPAVWLGGGRRCYMVAFAAGLCLVQAVIALKALGILIVGRRMD